MSKHELNDSHVHAVSKQPAGGEVPRRVLLQPRCPSSCSTSFRQSNAGAVNRAIAWQNGSNSGGGFRLRSRPVHPAPFVGALRAFSFVLAPGHVRVVFDRD